MSVDRPQDAGVDARGGDRYRYLGVGLALASLAGAAFAGPDLLGPAVPGVAAAAGLAVLAALAVGRVDRTAFDRATWWVPDRTVTAELLVVAGMAHLVVGGFLASVLVTDLLTVPGDPGLVGGAAYWATPILPGAAMLSAGMAARTEGLVLQSAYVRTIRGSIAVQCLALVAFAVAFPVAAALSSSNGLPPVAAVGVDALVAAFAGGVATLYAVAAAWLVESLAGAVVG